MTDRMSPEVALAMACCRWPRSPERDDAVRAAAASVSDWSLFERLVAHHRIAPLARDGLHRAGVAPPPAVGERLGARAADRAVNALAMARESVRLQRAFRAAGLPALIIKGTAIGVLAYGDPAMKESWDIDLLTSPEALAEAHDLLESLGYELFVPGPMTRGRLVRFARFAVEAGYKHRHSGLIVELHWRVTKNRRLLPGVTVHSPSQAVLVTGAELLTFADDTLFAYLCAHGTHHAWVRLKWLADLGAFIAAREPEEIDRMYRSAVRTGAGRPAGASLLLCSRLLGTPVPPALLSEVSGDRSVRLIESVALHYVLQRDPVKTPILPPSAMFFSHLLLAPGVGYLAEEIAEIWIRPVERARFGFAFHLLRIPLWLGRVIGRTRGRLVEQIPRPVGD